MHPCQPLQAAAQIVSKLLVHRVHNAWAVCSQHAINCRQDLQRGENWKQTSGKKQQARERKGLQTSDKHPNGTINSLEYSSKIRRSNAGRFCCCDFLIVLISSRGSVSQHDVAAPGEAQNCMKAKRSGASLCDKDRSVS